MVFHYNNIVAFRENKKHLQENFPKRLTGMQMEKLQVLYEQLIQDDEMMQELEDKSMQQIADEMNVSVKTVISRKRYAVLFLRERLQFIYKQILNN